MGFQHEVFSHMEIKPRKNIMRKRGKEDYTTAI